MGERDGSIFKKMKSKNAKKHNFHLGGGTSVVVKPVQSYQEPFEASVTSEPSVTCVP